MIMKKIPVYGLLLACALVLLSAPDAFCITAQVVPDHISVDSLYHGSAIDIKGETTPGSDIIIKISSAAAESHLRKKGKAGGVLWMNVGELAFNPVSDVYLIYSTREINDILNREQQDQLVIGYDAFRRVVEVSPVDNEAEKEKWTAEFIKMKEMNKTYRVTAGEIQTVPGGNITFFSLHVDWPYQAPPQKYAISVYSVRDGVAQESAESELVVEKVGALQFISNMAFNSASLYGIISIIIAIAAGFIVSMIFKGGKGGAH